LGEVFLELNGLNSIKEKITLWLPLNPFFSSEQWNSLGANQTENKHIQPNKE